MWQVKILGITEAEKNVQDTDVKTGLGTVEITISTLDILFCFRNTDPWLVFPESLSCPALAGILWMPAKAGKVLWEGQGPVPKASTCHTAYVRRTHYTFNWVSQKGQYFKPGEIKLSRTLRLLLVSPRHQNTATRRQSFVHRFLFSTPFCFYLTVSLPWCRGHQVFDHGFGPFP